MNNNLNSNASIIGSLPSFEVVYDIIKYSSFGHLREEIIAAFSDTNLFNKRTEESRLRILRAIDNSILTFKNEKHENFINYVYSIERFRPYYPFVLFLQLLANNKLFYLICKNVFLEIYFSGRLYIKTEDVASYLYYLKESEQDLKKWTDSTIKTTSSKILTLLRKVDLIEGRRNKEIKYISLNLQQKVMLINFILAVEPNLVNILDSRYIGFFFIEKSNLIATLKDMKLTKYFDIYTTSNSVKINAKKEIKGSLDAIYN